MALYSVAPLSYSCSNSSSSEIIHLICRHLSPPNSGPALRVRWMSPRDRNPFAARHLQKAACLHLLTYIRYPTAPAMPDWWVEEVQESVAPGGSGKAGGFAQTLPMARRYACAPAASSEDSACRCHLCLVLVHQIKVGGALPVHGTTPHDVDFWILYSTLSTSASQLASMMFSETPTVPHRDCLSRDSMTTRTRAAVPSRALTTRTL
jgi:hypothetical protein